MPDHISIYNYDRGASDKLSAWPAHYLDWKPYVHPRWWTKFCISVEVLGLNPRAAYKLCQKAVERYVHD